MILATKQDGSAEPILFVSLNAAASALNIPGHSAVKRALDNNTVVNGYVIRKAMETDAPTQALVAQMILPPKQLLDLFGDDTYKMRYSDELEFVSLIDIIFIVTGMNNPHVMYERHFNMFSQSKHKFSGSGQRETPVVKYEQVPCIIQGLLANSRMGSKEIQYWSNQVGATDSYVFRRNGAIEYDCVDILVASLKRFTCIKKFHIGSYYLDLYIKEINVVVECDEYGHASYNQECEAERTRYVTDTLNCTWVRFNPNKSGFSIGDVIADILDIILS